MSSRYTFPRNVEKHKAMLRISIHQRNNNISDAYRESDSTQNVLARMYLYMPTSVQINDGLTYDNVDLSNLLSFGADLIDAGRRGMSGDDVSGITSDLGTRALSRVAGSGGVAAGAASQALIQRGRVLNPRTQMLFKGPVLRQFSFAFKLIPSNRAEAEDIFNMIRDIRENAYPSIGSEESNAIFVFPNIFRLEMVQNRGDGAAKLKMIRIADTYCTAVSTNYNPTANAFYEGGYPSEVDFTLTFQETRALDRAKIREGY